MAGGLCLLLADHLGWQAALAVISSLLVIGIIITLWADEPDGIKNLEHYGNLSLNHLKNCLKRKKPFAALIHYTV